MKQIADIEQKIICIHGKIKRLSRTIQTYLLSKKIPDGKEWQVDLLVVHLDLDNKKAKIKRIEDLIL